MYSLLNMHTHYSLLRGYVKSKLVPKIAEKNNISAVCITDFDSLSGSVDFIQNLNNTKIKPIIGTKIFLSDDGGYVTLLAMNKSGWKELVILSSKSYSQANAIPSLTFNDIAGCKNLILISGEPESTLANSLVKSRLAYTCKNGLQSFIANDGVAEKLMSKYKAAFGDRFFSAISRFSSDSCPVDTLVADRVRYISGSTGVRCVAVPPVYYAEKRDSVDHELLLCSYNKCTLQSLKETLNTENLAGLQRFVGGSNCYIPSFDKIKSCHDSEEIHNTNLVADMCEKYSILSNPKLPKFCKEGVEDRDYLKELCRKGWLRLKDKFDKSRIQEYVDRVKMELSVFEEASEANLESYFLIVQDIVNWARNQGMLVGPGRGSAGGCLVSYLTGIINIDPVINELYFERFYNKGRNAPGKISLPDIDCDFPVMYRHKVIEYIRERHGPDKVSQVATFSRLQGRGAIKEVLRIHDAASNDLMNQVTKKIPQEAEIADKMEEVKETSILRWTLTYQGEELKEWVTLDENGVLSGPLSQYFEQAIRIEGTYKSHGKHASAVIISVDPISEICPMIRDKDSGVPITSIEYESLELMGLPKFDILGTAILDKLMGVNQLLETGYIKLGDFNLKGDDNNEEE